MESFHSRVMAEVQKRMQSLKFKAIDTSSYVPLLRLRVVDLKSDGEEKSNTGTLTFWRPSEEVRSILAENTTFKIFNVTSGFLNNGEIQLKATKTTKVEKCGHFQGEMKRLVVPIHELVESANFQPMFNEVDTLGLLIKVEDGGQNGMQESQTPSAMRSFQTVYICDTLMNFVAIHFWKSISHYGYENLVQQSKLVSDNDADSIFYFRNLQWKKSQRYY